MRLLDEIASAPWCDQPTEQQQDMRPSVLTARVRACGSVADLSPHHRPHAGELLTVGADVMLAFWSRAERVGAANLRRAGTWYALTYHLGEIRSESGFSDTLKISRFHRPVESISADQIERASISCLVHERWLTEFAKSIGPGLSPKDDAVREGTYYLPTELRTIATHALVYDLMGSARQSYRAAKGIELLCETARLSMTGSLISYHAHSGLNAADIQRLVAAKKMVAEQFDKKLTLCTISRICGLNRAKLTRGFKILFGTSIGEALSEARLWQACMLLQTTSKPIANVGYEAGYLNNASFTRAFTRRYGVCPSSYRTNARHSLCSIGKNNAWLEETAA